VRAKPIVQTSSGVFLLTTTAQAARSSHQPICQRFVFSCQPMCCRGFEPPRRYSHDQLRHPLEPGPTHAAHRPCRSPHEPEIEERLAADHPESAGTRGKIVYWNFLPPDELNAILTLYTRVTQKILLISQTMGIEARGCCDPTMTTRRFESSIKRTRARRLQLRQCTSSIRRCSTTLPISRNTSPDSRVPSSAGEHAPARGSLVLSSVSRSQPSTAPLASSQRAQGPPAVPLRLCAVRGH